MSEIERAAIEWWLSHRPTGWGDIEHRAEPTVWLAEQALARAVAQVAVPALRERESSAPKHLDGFNWRCPLREGHADAEIARLTAELARAKADAESRKHGMADYRARLKACEQARVTR